MAHVYVDEDDVLDEMTVDEIGRYVKRRRERDVPKLLQAIGATDKEVREGALSEVPDKALLEAVYLKLRGTEQPAELREFIWRTIGRIL